MVICSCSCALDLALITPPCWHERSSALLSLSSIFAKCPARHMVKQTNQLVRSVRGEDLSAIGKGRARGRTTGSEWARGSTHIRCMYVAYGQSSLPEIQWLHCNTAGGENIRSSKVVRWRQPINQPSVGQTDSGEMREELLTVRRLAVGTLRYDRASSTVKCSEQCGTNPQTAIALPPCY